MKHFILFTLILSVLAFDSSNYSNNQLLLPEYRLYWKLNSTHIFLALEVTTTGWVGFGLGEPTSGSMHGSDILTGYVVNGVAAIQDRYATEKAFPSLDSVQDWKLVNGEEQNGKTIIEVYRALSTGNSIEDRPIRVGKTRIIFSFGESDSIGYHGSRRGSSQIEFIPDPNPIPPPTETDLRTLAITMTNYQVPTKETTYACKSFPAPSGISQIVKWSAIIQSQSVPYLHHFVIYGCLFDEWKDITKEVGECTNIFFRRCSSIVYAWAPGMDDQYLPPGIGIPIGNSSVRYNWLTLEVHYNNPDLVSGIVDSSGVEITYTSQLRPIDAGTFSTGDISLSAPSIDAGNSCVAYEFSCSPTCTRALAGPINIIGSTLHMHAAGKSIWTSHWRGAQNLGYTNRIEFWDFGFQHQIGLNVTLQPGDRLNTHCVYDTSSRTKPTVFGHSSLDEMCFDFLLYWPFDPTFTFCGYVNLNGQGYSACTNADAPEMNPVSFDPLSQLTRTFGDTSAPECLSVLQGQENTAHAIYVSLGLLFVLIFAF